MKTYQVKIQVYDDDKEDYICIFKNITEDVYLQIIDIVGVKQIFYKDKNQLTLDSI